MRVVVFVACVGARWRRCVRAARLVAAGCGWIAASAVGFGALTWDAGPLAAKTPGKTYCFLGVCHRVLTLAETRAQIGRRRVVYASHYDDCRRDRFNPCGLTSSGAVFRADKADNAASPIYPNGTQLLVFNPANGHAAVVRINNAGPYWGRRTLDLSRAAADKLGFRRRGVARLFVEVVQAPTRAEARYKRRRTYAPVKGYMGEFETVREAVAAAFDGEGEDLLLPARKPVQFALAGMVDPTWAPAAGRASATVGRQQVAGAVATVPLPEQPESGFKREIRRIAAAARRRRLALARAKREAAQRVALAEAKARQQADERREERRRRLAAAAKKKGAVRSAAKSKPTPERAVAAAPDSKRDEAQTATDTPANAQSAPEANPAPRRSRTVWRREILSIAQNAS